jgi:hypothetical protein
MRSLPVRYQSLKWLNVVLVAIDPPLCFLMGYFMGRGQNAIAIALLILIVCLGVIYFLAYTRMLEVLTKK